MKDPKSVIFIVGIGDTVREAHEKVVNQWGALKASDNEDYCFSMINYHIYHIEEKVSWWRTKRVFVAQAEMERIPRDRYM